MKRAPTCDGYKHGFRHRGEVPEHLRRVCTLYRCVCGKWHVTSKRKRRWR